MRVSVQGHDGFCLAITELMPAQTFPKQRVISSEIFCKVLGWFFPF